MSAPPPQQSGVPISTTTSRQARPPRNQQSVAQAQLPPVNPPDPLGLSLEDQVLRPLAHELVLSSTDLANTTLVSRHNGSPPWFEVHTFVTAAVPAPASAPAAAATDEPGEGAPARRVTRIRRRPHHRQPNDSDVLCLLVGVSDADRDMTIQFPGQASAVRVRKFFKKGLINSDVYAFGDARGNKWEWRERRYGYDLSLHEADKPDYQVLARYTSGIGTSSRPYIEYSPQGQLMLDLVVATFFALENSMRAISSRPSLMRALSRMGSVLRSPGPGERTGNTPVPNAAAQRREDQLAVAPEPLLPPLQVLRDRGTPPPVSPAASGQLQLQDGMPRRSMQGSMRRE